MIEKSNGLFSKIFGRAEQLEQSSEAKSNAKLEQLLNGAERRFLSIVKRPAVRDAFLASEDAVKKAEQEKNKVHDEAVEIAIPENIQSSWRGFTGLLGHYSDIDEAGVKKASDQEIAVQWKQATEVWKEAAAKLQDFWPVIDDFWVKQRSRHSTLPKFEKFAHFLVVGKKLSNEKLTPAAARLALLDLKKACDELSRIASEPGSLWRATVETSPGRKKIGRDVISELKTFSNEYQQLDLYMQAFHGLQSIDKAVLKKSHKRILRAKVLRDIVEKFKKTTNFSEQLIDPKQLFPNWIQNGVDNEFYRALIGAYLPYTSEEKTIEEVTKEQKKRRNKWVRFGRKVLLLSMLSTLWMQGSSNADRPDPNRLSGINSNENAKVLTLDEDGNEVTSEDESGLETDTALPEEEVPFYIESQDQFEPMRSYYTHGTPDIRNNPLPIDYAAMRLEGLKIGSDIPKFFPISTYDWMFFSPESHFKRFSFAPIGTYNRYDLDAQFPNIPVKGDEFTISFMVGTNNLYDINQGIIPLAVPSGFVPVRGTVGLYKPGQENSYTPQVFTTKSLSFVDGTAWMTVPNSMLATADEGVDGEDWMYSVTLEVARVEDKSDDRAVSEYFEESFLESENLKEAGVAAVFDMMRAQDSVEEKAETLGKWLEENMVFSLDPLWSDLYDSAASKEEFAAYMLESKQLNHVQAAWLYVELLRSQGIPARMVRGFYNENQDRMLNTNEVAYWVQIDGSNGLLTDIPPLQFQQSDWYTQQLLAERQMGVHLNLNPPQVSDAAGADSSGATGNPGAPPSLDGSGAPFGGEPAQNGEPTLPLPESYSDQGMYQSSELLPPGSLAAGPVQPESEYQPVNGGENFHEKRKNTYWTISGVPMIGYAREVTYSIFSLDKLTWAVQEMSDFTWAAHQESPSWIPDSSVVPQTFMHTAWNQQTNYFDLDLGMNIPTVFRPGFTLTIPLTDVFEPHTLVVRYSNQSVSVPIEVTLIPNQGVFTITVTEVPNLWEFSNLHFTQNAELSVGLVPRTAEHQELIEQWPTSGLESAKLLDGVHFPNDVEDLLAAVEEMDSEEDKATAIIDFIKEKFTYSLDPSWSDTYNKSTSSAEYFSTILLHRKTDCDFAATMAIALMRHVGLSARLPAGYANTGREFDTESNALRGDEGHGWVEVRIGGTWVEMDPTPTQFDNYTERMFEQAQSNEEYYQELSGAGEGSDEQGGAGGAGEEAGAGGGPGGEEQSAPGGEEVGETGGAGTAGEDAGGQGEGGTEQGEGAGAGVSSEEGQGEEGSGGTAPNESSTGLEGVGEDELYSDFEKLGFSDVIVTELQKSLRLLEQWYEEHEAIINQRAILALIAAFAYIFQKRKREKIKSKVDKTDEKIKQELFELLTAGSGIPEAQREDRSYRWANLHSAHLREVVGIRTDKFVTDAKQSYKGWHNRLGVNLLTLINLRSTYFTQKALEASKSRIEEPIVSEQEALSKVPGASEALAQKIIRTENFIEMTGSSFESFVDQWSIVSNGENLIDRNFSITHIALALENSRNYETFISKLAYFISDAEQGLLIDDSQKDDLKIKAILGTSAYLLKKGIVHHSASFNTQHRVTAEKLKKQFGLLTQTWWAMRPVRKDIA